MAQFPAAFVDAVATAAADVIGVVEVVKRPVRMNDPDSTVGIYALDWNPGTDEEISAPVGGGEPTLSRYHFQLSFLLKHVDQALGHRLHAEISKSLRVMVARDPDLLVALASLSETLHGVTERFQKKRVQRQRFMAGEVRSKNVFLSVMEFWIEVEAR